MKRVIAILLAVTLLLFAVSCGGTDSADETLSLAISVTELSGTVRTLRGDGTAEVLSAGNTLYLGDSVITDRDSCVTLSIKELDAVITVSPSSEIVFNIAESEGEDTRIVILIRKGSISNSVNAILTAGDIYEVCTGDLTMAIRGTDAYVSYENGTSSVALLTGTALVYSYDSGFVYTVPSGISALFADGSQPVFELIDTSSFGSLSLAAESMLNRVAAENSSYADNFETELRDSYIAEDADYTFTVSSAVETPSEDVSGESDAQASADADEENSQPAEESDTSETADTEEGSESEETASTTVSSTTSTAAAATTASSAASTTVSTTAPTTATTTTTTTTTTTATTTTTTTAATTTSSTSSAPTTTTTSAITGGQYLIEFIGLYKPDGLGGYELITGSNEAVWSGYPLESVTYSVSFTYGEDDYVFSFTLQTANIGLYDGTASGILYSTHLNGESYTNIYTYVKATPVSAD